MSDLDRQDARFGELVNAALDRCISESDWRALCALLSEDAAARAEFRHRAELHAMLRWDAVHAEVDGDEDLAIVEPIEPARIAGRIEPASRRSRAWIVAAGLAAAVAITATTALMMRPVEPRHGDGVAMGPAVGVLLDDSGAQWTSAPIDIGGDVRSGLVGISGGRVDLELRTGVSLSMQGAGSMYVTNESRVRLNAGTLHAVVPQGAEGFTVDGPRGLRIVDLGTAFTVTVDSDTASFVAVNKGRVRIEPGTGEPIDVTAGFVAEVIMPDTADQAAGVVRVTAGDRFRALAHRWTFNDGSLRDDIGAAHGRAMGGAAVAEGTLRLDGVDDFVITEPAVNGLREKTLVAWVSPATLDQRGGGVLTVQRQLDRDVFDGIVYGERTPRVWIAGSNEWSRTQPLPQGGVPEDATPDQAVTIAIAYDGDGTVRVYREGVLYGSYRAGSVMDFDDARVLMGLRHSRARPATGPDGVIGTHFGGAIDEARVYGRALSGEEIAQMQEEGPLRPAPADADAGDAETEQPLEGDTR